MDSGTTTTNNDSSNLRNELSQDSRQKIVNKIMDALQRHMPFTGPDGMNELKKIALRFEEKIYAAAVDQQDYLRKISLKMLSLRIHVSRDGNSLAGGSSSSNQKPLDPVVFNIETGLLMLPQMRNKSHSPDIVSGNDISLPEQPQPQEASLPQNEKVILSASGMQNSAGLPSTLSSMTNFSQSTSGVVFGTESAPYNWPGQILPHNALLQQPQQSVLRQQQSVLQQQPSILQQQQPSIFNVSNMQTQQHQQLQQIIQSETSQYQRVQQPSSPSLLQHQSQQLQEQLQQKLLLTELEHQPQQLQQQPPLLPQWNSVQQELQQRLHTPGGLLQQQQSSVEQQKQLLQAQIQRLSDVPTTSVESSGQTGQSNVIDHQERIYQKLQRLKDIYFPDLRELRLRLSMKCQQPMAADQLDKLELYRTKVHRMMQYFQVSKGNIPPGFPEDKIDAVEKQIQSVLDSFKPGKPALRQQQGQQQFLPESYSHLHSMQQQSQSLMPQLQQQEKHSNQLQLMNLEASATSMQPNTVAPIQHSSMPQLQQQPFNIVPALSVCSPQLLPAVSPQVYQQSSPQLDQQGLVASSLPVSKLGTPMQPVTLPFTASSPSTLQAPSPMEDAVKQSSAIPNIGSSQGLKQTTNARSHSNSLAIGTPGISALPLLANFSSNPAQNTVNQNGHKNVSPGPLMEDKLSTKEPPFEHLIKVVGQDMGVNEAIFESMKMSNTYDLFRQPLLTKYCRRLLFRALTLLSVLGFTAYVIYTSRANSS